MANKTIVAASRLQQCTAWFQRKISPRDFTRVALILSGIWFLGVYPLMNCFAPKFLPTSLRVTDCDFGQYYIGATVVKNGIWDALYPIAKPGIYNNPPQFQPKYKTFLFREQDMAGKMCYYPSIAHAGVSDFAPKLLAYCPELKDHFSFRFMYPPPLAVLLWPLAAWDYEFWP